MVLDHALHIGELDVIWTGNLLVHTWDEIKTLLVFRNARKTIIKVSKAYLNYHGGC